MDDATLTALLASGPDPVACQFCPHGAVPRSEAAAMVLLGSAPMCQTCYVQERGSDG